MRLEACDAVAALIAHVEEIAAWIECAVPRIIPHGRDFSEQFQFPAAAD